MAGMFGTCPKCGGAYSAGSAFCSRCGQPLEGLTTSPPSRRRRIGIKTAAFIALGVLVLVGAIVGGVAASSDNKAEAVNSSGDKSAEAVGAGQEPLSAAETAYLQSIEPVLTEFHANLQVLDASLTVTGQGVSGSGSAFSDSVGGYIDGLEHFNSSLQAMATFPPRLEALVPPERFREAHTYLLKGMNGFSAMADAQLGRFNLSEGELSSEAKENLTSSGYDENTDEAVDELIQALGKKSQGVDAVLAQEEITELREAATRDYSRGLDLLATAVPD